MIGVHEVCSLAETLVNKQQSLTDPLAINSFAAGRGQVKNIHLHRLATCSH